MGLVQSSVRVRPRPPSPGRRAASPAHTQVSSLDVRAVLGPVSVHTPDLKILLLLYCAHASSL